MKAGEKLSIKREAAKRMMLKGMDSDYIKEITELSKKQIRHMTQINESFIGDNDLYLRKKYASDHHLMHRYYLEHRTRFYTGVDIEKSDFYRNRFLQTTNNRSTKEIINGIPKCYANSLRIKTLLNIGDYLNNYNKYLDVLKLPYKFEYLGLETYDIYRDVTHKIKEYEEEKLVLDLLSVEKNLKKIAFICDLTDETIESIVDKNSIFMSNGKIDLKRIKNKCEIWERELVTEIAKRSTDSWPAVENNMKLLGLPRDELEKYFKQFPSQKGEEYEMRRKIVERLMPDAHSVQDMSEISGIHKFYIEFIVDKKYYNKFFSKYYDRYANEKLIKYESI